MARKRPVVQAEAIIVNVLYEDGSQTSNRRINGVQLSGIDDDAVIRQAVEDQDRKIAEMSGQPRAPIKSVKRAASR